MLRESFEDEEDRPQACVRVACEHEISRYAAWFRLAKPQRDQVIGAIVFQDFKARSLDCCERNGRKCRHESRAMCVCVSSRPFCSSVTNNCRVSCTRPRPGPCVCVCALL